MAKGRILVVDDEIYIVHILDFSLGMEGYEVLTALDGEQALEKARTEKPDLIVLDIMMPKLDGYETCKRLKADADTKDVPVILLSAKGRNVDQKVGFEVGADDYITKPFSMRELVARVNAVLRRVDGIEPSRPVYDDGVLMIDPSAFSVRCQGREVRLTRKEFALLEELARNQGRVLTREALLDRVWGLAYYGDSRTLDVHIRRLRQKLGDPALIETVTGVGYRLSGK